MAAAESRAPPGLWRSATSRRQRPRRARARACAVAPVRVRRGAPGAALLASLREDAAGARVAAAGVGSLALDMLATVESYPSPDEKVRSTALAVQGGGNAGNAAVALKRLGVGRVRLLAKVGRDGQGATVEEQLTSEGVGVDCLVRDNEGGSTPFTYILVAADSQTRTCVHTPGAPLRAEEVSDADVARLLEGAHVAWFDGRLTETALRVARRARQAGVPVLVEGERLREPQKLLDELLEHGDVVALSASYARQRLACDDEATALGAMVASLPQARWVSQSRGAEGALMVERVGVEGGGVHTEVDEAAVVTRLVGALLASEQPLEPGEVACVEEGPLRAWRVDAETVNVVDTTGAGDAFNAVLVLALARCWRPDEALALAAHVAARKCTALGARAALPYAPFVRAARGRAAANAA